MEALQICVAIYGLIVISLGITSAIYLAEIKANDEYAKKWFANLVFFPILLPFIWIPKCFWFAIKNNLK